MDDGQHATQALSPRARQILYACVTEFVSTGVPVGSRTLAEKGIDLSPASIRSVLADLEDLGFLRQPHTSAGRVPTDRAFRLFIDAMMKTQALTRADHDRIRTRLDDIEPGQNVYRETGRMLSELTGAAAVVVAPRLERVALKHLRFMRTSPGELLVVLVLSNGNVQNRFLRAEATEDDLVRVHNLLDDVIEGRTLGELRDLFARRLGDKRVQADVVRKRAFELGDAALKDLAPDADLVIEGRAKLLGLPDFAGDGVRGVITALEEQERIVHLLDATLEADGAAVLVGREAGELGDGQLSIISAVYRDGGRSTGAVGVIGPTRMDYPKVVPLVAATAEAMSELFDRNAARGGQDPPDRDG